MSQRGVRRGAFTLIELLVAMSIIVVLASLTLLVVTNMSERDGTTDAAGLTRQWLMIAKNKASRDQAPRGLRLVVGMDPTNPVKTSPFWVTECQYIEAPPILVTFPAQNNDSAPAGSPTDPAVWFTYTTSPNPPPMGYPPTGTIIRRECQIVNLRPGEAAQVQRNCILQLPTLGTWHRIVNVVSVTPMTGASAGLFAVRVTFDPTNATPANAALELLNYPDAQLGASGVAEPQPQPAAGATPPCFVTQLFGITSPPRPVLAEPPLQVPKNICIDVTYTQDQVGNPIILPTPGNPTTFPTPLPAAPYFEAPSRPQANPAGTVDYDILFAPNGTVLPVGAGAATDGMIVLWHRDYTKIRGLRSPLAITNIGGAPNFTRTYDLAPFQNGGEQQIVAIRCKSGALGQFPVLWPNATGLYTGTDDPFTLARSGTTAP